KHACQDLVTAALASHLAVDPLAIDPQHRLADDWGLLALDLVLVAMRLEDTYDVVVSLDEVARAVTVSDFARATRGLSVEDAVHSFDAPAMESDGSGAHGGIRRRGLRAVRRYRRALEQRYERRRGHTGRPGNRVRRDRRGR